ncbi:MAG: hypothetical protein KDB00_14045 [Planctomycetales bacterium]|nr:hypothetical protein [Planctomycetales bacterium]
MMTTEPTIDPHPDDVSLWIVGAEAGNDEAVARLWEHCLPRLVSYSRSKLPSHLRRVLDEEDVALSAFKSFCFRAADGTLGEINGRDELWKLLFCITSRKASGYIRHQTREKRGGGLVGGESTFMKGTESTSDDGINQVPDHSPNPAIVAEFENNCQHLLDQLDDTMLQTIAVLRLEGYNVDEIAARVGCAKRSVERRLNLIRTIWQSEEDGSD